MSVLLVASHTPVLVDCSGDTRYAICSTCEQDIESWWNDGDDDRTGSWSRWGIRVAFLNGNGVFTLDKDCKGEPSF